MVLVKYASRCDVLVYEHLTDPEVAAPCGDRSPEYTEWPTCRTCHNHVCINHRMRDTLEDDEGRETVLCRDCYWSTVREKDRRAGARGIRYALAQAISATHGCVVALGCAAPNHKPNCPSYSRL